MTSVHSSLYLSKLQRYSRRITNSHTHLGQAVIYPNVEHTLLQRKDAVHECGPSVALPFQLLKRHKTWLWIFTWYFPTPKSIIHNSSGQRKQLHTRCSPRATLWGLWPKLTSVVHLNTFLCFIF